ncbi:MAG: NAD-dependent epimerase/dehydratase family protein [Candidatus Stahlbacteria bacterium]|nr:NAD-dependent epimerase/dehydratase family protein [Candidatus Stahlbacteria bacterium]
MITGASGLIGSEGAIFFSKIGWEVVGIDSNMRKYFFGDEGDTIWNLNWLKNNIKNFQCYNIDIRARDNILALFKENKFDLILHCAAQPSHDWAKKEPFVDFDINAVGTLNLLEATRLYNTKATFIYTSTNKVYGDAPNELQLKELETRWEYANKEDYNGIDENCRIDKSTHSLFGASKLAGDILAQEYGRYFGLKVGIFRAGCITGGRHSGVELHGFLSYLVKVAKSGGCYEIFGYKGKQVRDNIHSYDIVNAFYHFYQNPKIGEVYNIGGCRKNSVSVLEAIARVQGLLDREIKYTYIDKHRVGDHICYISNMSKFKSHYPNWRLTKSLDDILKDMLK